MGVTDFIALIDRYGFKTVGGFILVIIAFACMNGIKCLLRSEMLQIYYTCEEKKEIRQYQLENFHRMYRAYKFLFGNSFIDEIRSKVITYRVIT